MIESEIDHPDSRWDINSEGATGTKCRGNRGSEIQQNA